MTAYSHRRNDPEFAEQWEEAESQSVFHLRAQRSVDRRRDVRLQSRSFARWNQSLIRNPNSNRLC
jgi:hypothetical protein